MAGYINNLDQLQFWFEKLGKAEWNLYRGHLNKVSPSALIYKNEEPLSVEESYQLLVEMMQMNSNGGGRFTVYVPDKSSNRGCTVKVGLNIQEKASAGLGGFNPSAQLQGLVSVGEVDRKIAEAREKWDLERRLEDMEIALEQKVPLGEKLLEKALDEGGVGKIVDLCSNLINGIILKVAQPQKAQVSMNGFPPVEDEPAPEGYTYDQEQILTFLDQVRPHFENEASFYAFLSGVALKFSEQPDFFKGMILGQKTSTP